MARSQQHAGMPPAGQRKQLHLRNGDPLLPQHLLYGTMVLGRCYISIPRMMLTGIPKILNLDYLYCQSEAACSNIISFFDPECHPDTQKFAFPQNFKIPTFTSANVQYWMCFKKNCILILFEKNFYLGCAKYNIKSSRGESTDQVSPLGIPGSLLYAPIFQLCARIRIHPRRSRSHYSTPPFSLLMTIKTTRFLPFPISRGKSQRASRSG